MIIPLYNSSNIANVYVTGCEVQRGTKQKLDLLYGVDFEGSSLLHLAIDSGVLKVS